MRNYLLSLSAMLLAGAAHATPASDINPCQPTEQAMFACTHTKQTYALCSSKDANATTGYMQYRVTGGKTPFLYPDTLKPAKGLFSYMLLGKGGVLSFIHEGYRYELSSDMQGSHIRVLQDKDEKRLADFDCLETMDTGLDRTPVIETLTKMGLYPPQ